MSEQHTHEELHQLGIAHSHGHGHTHTHENTKAVLNRMAKCSCRLPPSRPPSTTWAR